MIDEDAANFPEDDIPDKDIINYESLFDEEDIDDFELFSSEDEEMEPRAPASSEGQTGSRVSNNRLDSQPIAQRTRANISYNELELKDLEGLLHTEEAEELAFGKDLDDVEEYEKFLSSLRNQEGESNYNGLGMDGNESEDEDFIQELKRMLEDQAEENYFGNFPPVKTGDPNITSEMPLKKLNMLFTKGSKSKKKTKVRRSARLAKGRKQLYAAKLATRRSLIIDENGLNRHKNMKDLNTLAVVMGAPVNSAFLGPLAQIPLPSEFGQGMDQNLAKRVTWKPPLPKAMRKIHSELIAVSRPGTFNNNVVENDAERKIALFGQGQYHVLQLQFKQSIQLIVQISCISALQKNKELLKEAKSMLTDLSDLIAFLNVSRSAVCSYIPYGMNANNVSCFNKILNEVYVEWIPIVQSLLLSLECLHDQEINLPEGLPPRLLWSRLPVNIHRSIAPIRVFFDQNLEPSAPGHINTVQMKFTPAEDRLLAWGIRKHAYNWEQICKDFLPNKDPKSLFVRKKNKVTTKAPDNIIKDVVRSITMPLTEAEIEVLRQAIKYYGRQTGKWDQICRENLPYRHPHVLSMLWSDYTKTIEETPKKSKK
eukprot:jgi/Picsp_1/6500/NSC_03844-R1_duo pollen 3